jgi:hypothetical protein
MTPTTSKSTSKLEVNVMVGSSPDVFISYYVAFATAFQTYPITPNVDLALAPS